MSKEYGRWLEFVCLLGEGARASVWSSCRDVVEGVRVGGQWKWSGRTSSRRGFIIGVVTSFGGGWNEHIVTELFRFV